MKQHDLHVVDYEIWKALGRRSLFNHRHESLGTEGWYEDFDIVTEQREGWAYD